LRCFGYVECKDGGDWAKAMYVEGKCGNYTEGRPKKNLVKLCLG